jgi:uncharacterized protein YecE (DUF72 family)
VTRLEGARVGVAGWSYPDWDGIVYPRTPGVDGLAFLARIFDTVEVNSSFYRVPSERTASSWARRARTNANFRFTLKLYRRFTHDRILDRSDERSVKKSLAPLVDEGLFGALLAQFPWSFKNEPASRTYLTELLDRFREYPLVVEVRHASWSSEEFYSFLKTRGVGFCNVDQPLIGRSLGPTDRATGPVGYVRLHGRNYQDWFREDAGRDARYDYLYSKEELEPWIEKIAEVSEAASSTYVITNNHFRGQAVVNALQIRARIEGRKVPAPPSLLERYPVLESSAEADGPRQGELF